MSIDAYFRQIAELIAACSVVQSSNITFDKRARHEGYFRGELHFVDGSVLHAREFVDKICLDLHSGRRYNAMAEKQKFCQERNVMNEATIQLRDKGVITLPMSLRRKYSLRTGDVFSVSDLGEGVFMITPKSSRVAALGDKVAEILRAEGVSVEDLLEGLDEERERYYREHYVNG